MGDNKPTMYALLVGINDYPNLQVEADLDGCLNDTLLMRQVLQQSFGVHKDNIEVLHNEQATYKAIKRTFQEHLIGHARRWDEAGRQEPPPAFLYHFSGHGSRAPDETGQEPDGFDETTVPYDSRTPGVFDIRDWELGQWLEELSDYSENVTVILDCCHSGSGTRELIASPVKVRTCPPDDRPQPTHRPAPSTGSRSIAPAGGAGPALRHVLLSACLDRELAKEMELVKQTSGGERKIPFGALTLNLVQEIRNLSKWAPERRVTYRELYERVRRRVTRQVQDQTPQCEGDRDRELFGALRRQWGPFFTVVEVKDGEIWVDGGLAHGLTAGSLFHAYPPETHTLPEAGDPLATLRIKAVGAVRSLCTVEGSVADVPIHARAAIHRLNYGDMQRTVVLDMADAALEEEMREGLGNPEVAPYVRLVPAGAQANLRVYQEGDRLEIQDAGGGPLVVDYDQDTRHNLPADLAHLVRYYNTMELENRVDRSGLDGSVNIEVKKLILDPSSEADAKPFSPEVEGELIVEHDESIVIEIANLSKGWPVEKYYYVSLLDFGSDWSVVPVYPDQDAPGAHEMLFPGITLRLGHLGDKGGPIAPQLFDDVGEMRQVLKVIATAEEADFAVLQQDALGEGYSAKEARAIGEEQTAPSALSQLLEMAMLGGRATREGAEAGSSGDQWTTTAIEFHAVQPGDSPAIMGALQGGERSSVPAYRLEFEPPEGFEGEVRILTERQHIRETGEPVVAVSKPPSLVRSAGAAQLLSITPTRPTATVGAVVEIAAGSAARGRVTAGSPLQVSLPRQMAGGGATLAVAHNGAAYYVLGCADEEQDSVGIEHLPAPAVDGKALQVYFYRIPALPDWLVEGWEPARPLPWAGN